MKKISKVGSSRRRVQTRKWINFILIQGKNFQQKTIFICNMGLWHRNLLSRAVLHTFKSYYGFGLAYLPTPNLTTIILNTRDKNQMQNPGKYKVTPW